MDNRPLAIIDSGLGGLAIAQAIWQQLPHQSTLYLADHAHFPYGQKTTEEINRRLVLIFNFLLQKNCKAVVIACNTITASSIKYLRQLYSLPIIGTEPAIKPALQANLKENIVVWATPGTLNLKSSFQVKAIGCNNLASAIESYADKPEKLDKVIKKYLAKNPSTYSALVLGCTHYILIKDRIKKLLPAHVLVIEPSQAIAQQTAKVLSDHNLLPLAKTSQQLFFTTANPKRAGQVASIYLKRRIIFTSCSL
ncbi:glutamate racemase [Patescibacteria group bacterium]|nr:glutamate racemase [Patescibacteria group bacterium]